MKILDRFRRFWLFRVANPVVREGEHGGFKWKFRRYSMEISTLSGNWSARWTAAPHPYGYLVQGEEDDNIEGFCQMMYQTGMLLTTDQKLVDDLRKAFERYEKRLVASAEPESDAEDDILASERQVQGYAEMSRPERRRKEREQKKIMRKITRDLAEK